MEEYTHSATDLKSLIGEQYYSGYADQQQEQELLEAASEADDPLPTCYFCKKVIDPDQPVNLHHPTYRSNGGTRVEPAHESCHVEYHSREGDFRAWGKLSAQTRAWAFNLKNVKDNPTYDFDRQYYLMLYAH
jgi:hypothetical protein